MSARCPVCRKIFHDGNGVRQHAAAKHKKHHDVEPIELDREPSFADMAIEAEQLRDAGLPVPEDIAWLLP